jgi:enterochelin esterase-like enzyme
LTAAYVAEQRPDVFGKVLSQSGAFWRPRPEEQSSAEGWLPGKLAARKPTPIGYYLEVGRFEAIGMVEGNRRMRDVLRARGNAVIYREYNGGHDHANWRISVGDGLAALLGRQESRGPNDDQK